MFKKTLKITGVVLGVVVCLFAAFYLKAHVSTESRIHQVYAVVPQQLTPSSDSAILAYGKRLITTKGCNDCHGADLGGKIFIDDPALGLIVARNLTRGKGGLPEDFEVSDWVLALKHGIRKTGLPLLVMPADEYTHLTEKDMTAIISYCSQVPAVDRELPPSGVGPLARVLTELGKLPLLPVEKIDHSRKLTVDLKAEVSIEYGKYLSNACQGCHREHMKGGEPIAPGFPVVADISSTGNPGKWTAEQFMQTLRTGHTPEGKALKASEMPWTMTRAYTDIELKALHLYLQSI
jgi:mono/diheme cytochrome c family protein